MDDQVTYAQFLERKAQDGTMEGFAPLWMPSSMFDFQQSLADWAIRKGKCAIFADCGLGKSLIEQVWAENVHRHTNRPTLILTPLAVAQQMVREGEKFGIEVHRTAGEVHPGINVTNYEKLHHFNPADFAGVVCDESSAIKAMNGKRRAEVTEFLRTIPYRLLATATAAPNDYIELGTSSEALGVMGQVDMLNRFFKNDQNTSDMRMIKRRSPAQGGPVSAGWRFKGHAEVPFFRWVCSWARSCRRPSDLGFSDTRFILPPLIQREHIVETRTLGDGFLFALPAANMQEERDERRRTIPERCELAAELAQSHKHSVIWCQLNDEGDLLEKLIPHSLQVSGSDTDDYKETAFEWFAGTRCICNETWFGAKLATWQRVLRTTGKSDIVNTETSDLLNLSSISESMPSKNENTSSSTTNNTRPRRQNTENCTALNGRLGSGSDTNQTRITGPRKRQRSKITEGESPKCSGLEISSHSGLLSMTTAGCSPLKMEGAPSAAVGREISEPRDTTLITATRPERCEGSSALDATSGLGNSAMTPCSSKRRQCICGHESGPRRIITKSKIGGFGLNWQHCSHIVTFASHSYEQYYQSVRRCWRFGQDREVIVDLISTEGERGIKDNMRRKSEQADRMFTLLTRHMGEAMRVQHGYEFNQEVEVPSWL